MALTYHVRRAERHRSTVHFILLRHGELYTALDATKAADYVLLGLSPENEVDTKGDLLLRCLQAQGLPQTLAAAVVSTAIFSTLYISDNPAQPRSTPADPKAQTSILKSLLSFAQYFVPSLTRIFDLASTSDTANALRSLCEGKPSDVRWREGRSWLLAEDVSMEEPGTLKVTGVVRGAAMSADRLLHLPGLGDFRVRKVRCTHIAIEWR